MTGSNGNSVADSAAQAGERAGGRFWIVVIALLAIIAVGLNLWVFLLLQGQQNDLAQREINLLARVGVAERFIAGARVKDGVGNESGDHGCASLASHRGASRRRSGHHVIRGS